MLVKAVDEVVTVKEWESFQVSEIAASLVNLTNDFSP